jgi:predicted DNA-binding transcriptional regulator AlpA
MSVITNAANRTCVQSFPYDETLFMILEGIGRRMNATVPYDVGFWSVKEIAAYLKKSRATVQKKIVNLPGFPKAIQLPAADGGYGQSLWKAKEVMEWANSGQAA